MNMQERGILLLSVSLIKKTLLIMEQFVEEKGQL